MPLDKRWRGYRVLRSRRHGNQILVRLQHHPGTTKPNHWLTLSEAEYREGLSCVYRHGRPA